jgi:chloramphenicol 3-O-phosphotransferase
MSTASKEPFNTPTNLVFIEGAPSVGKMTVANELAELTGYKSFHNHLTQDLAGIIHPEWSQPRFDLVDKMRLIAFKNAAETGTDIIFTYVYGGTPNETVFLSNTVETFENDGGLVRFVNLHATSDTQDARVESESRKEFGKITDVESLRHRMSQYVLNPIFPQNFELSLDTTHSDPKQTALAIKDTLQLI